MGTAGREMRESLRNERGASMIEYALLAALIAMVCVPVITMAGVNIMYPFKDASECFAGGGSACTMRGQECEPNDEAGGGC